MGLKQKKSRPGKAGNPQAVEKKKPFGTKFPGVFSKVLFDLAVDYDLRTFLAASEHAVGRAYAQRQREALSEKYCSPDTAPASVRFSRGIAKFLLAEAACRDTNARFGEGTLSSVTYRVLDRARHYIFRCLPAVDDALLDRVCEYATPGPGANVFRKGDENSLAYKLGSFASVTRRAKRFLTRFYRVNAGMLQRTLELNRKHLRFTREGGPNCDLLEGEAQSPRYPSVCEADTLFAVPKNAEIDRIAGKQPDFNLWMQLGVAKVLEPCIRRFFGCDVRDQSLGHEKARHGSVMGTWCTVDLSSASDLIALALIRYLLPPDWFALLDLLRSHAYEWVEDGVSHGPTEYHKFSAMGNGFTFPLETMVFQAICWGVCDELGLGHNSVVYGDDIVIETEAYALLCSVLLDLGMKPNPEKSFADGPFRETCGKDFFLGVDIRPWFIHADPATRPDLYALHNCIAVHPWGGAIFSTTLRYLRSLDPAGYRQPFYYGAGENWWDWEEWKAREACFAFMVDESEAPAPEYHPGFQRLNWKLSGFTYSDFDLEVPEEFHLGLSLYTGSHQAKAFRKGRWTSRKKSVARWHGYSSCNLGA